MDRTMQLARSRGLVVVLIVLALVVGAAGLRADAAHKRKMPTDALFESRTGVRVTRVALVGDGGLVDMRYVVLDTQKAKRWFGNTRRPPKLNDRTEGESFYRVAAMRQGHELRAGQTYYLIYLNTDGAIDRGDVLDVAAAGDRLAKVPVR